MDTDILVLLGNLTIGGAPLVPVVIGLVSLAKRVGMPGKYAPYLNGGLSVVAYLAVTLLQKYPAYMQMASVITLAITLFLVSSGVYQLSKTSPAKSG